MASRSSRRSSSRPAARPPAGRASARASTRASRGPATMPFSLQNYRLLLGALALVVAGYAVMLLDNAREASSVDSTLSLFVAPLLLLAGYVGVAGAVLWGVPREADPTLAADDLADDAEA